MSVNRLTQSWVAAGVVLLVLVIVATAIWRAPSSESSQVSESWSSESEASNDVDRSEDRSLVRTSPYKAPEGRIQFRVRDLLSERGLGKYTITLVLHRGGGDLGGPNVFMADRDGKTGVDCDMSNIASIIVKLAQRDGGREFTLPFKELVQVEDSLVAFVPAYAGLKLILRTVNGEAAPTAARFNVCAVPPGPDASGMSEKELQRLMASQGSVESYRRILGSMNRLPTPDVNETIVRKRGIQETLWVPYEGEVAISGVSDSHFFDQTKTQITIGTLTQAIVKINPKPVISGMLVRETDDPIPHHRVNVSCHMEFPPGSTIPSTRGAGSAGTILVTEIRSGISHLSYVLGCNTDKDGRFALYMPMAGNVHVYAFVEGAKYASATTTVSIDTDLEKDLKLVASTEDPNSRMQFVDDNGVPLAGRNIQIMRVNKGVADTSITLPNVELDENGFMNLGWLEPDREYYAADDMRGIFTLGRRPPKFKPVSNSVHVLTHGK